MYVLIDFLMAIKEEVHPIRPHWVITHDAEQYFNAWIAVFGMGPKKLLCTWHIDRAWRKALSGISDKETAALVYHNLRLLMEESDKNKFSAMLKETLAQLNESPLTSGFRSYIETHYAKRPGEWAACFRKSSNINTNMYVESFHRTLKYVYMKGKINKTVDNLLHILIKISRDKAFERICKVKKGKVSGRLTIIRKRHWESTKLPFQSLVTKNKDGREWKVMSQDREEEYTVTCEHDYCPQGCHLVCSYCQVCILMYTCTCMDYLINHTICKHIHLVSFSELKITKRVISSEPVGTIEPSILPENSTSDDMKVTNIKDRLHQVLSKIHVQMETCTSEHDLLMADSHARSAVCILELSSFNGKRALPLPSKVNPPDNARLYQLGSQNHHKNRS